MKHTEVRVGKRVLYNHNRMSNPRYNLNDSYEAEILEIGLYHEFQVRVSDGAYQSRFEKRTSNRGVKIRITRAPYQRKPVVQGETELLPETYEKVVEAAFLRPAFGDVYEAFKVNRLKRAMADKSAEVAREKRAGVVAGFAALGVEIRSNGALFTLNEDGAREVLRRLTEGKAV